jgi:Family of unknown function (DUF5947)
VTGQTGLRRFVRPPAGLAPAAPAAPAPAAQPTRAPVLAPEAVAAMGSLPGQRSTGQQADAPERCELCATVVPAEHGHVADLEGASLLCACRACYLLFTQRTAGRGRYRTVPDRYLADAGRVMTPAEWDQLEIPVGLAFFLHTSRDGGGLTGFYPSPAGVTECILDLQLWEQLVAEYPLLGAADDDVEAALISRSDGGVEYFLVPIDACYELAGRMRLYWHGFDGGTEARESIAAFLADLRKRARQYSQDD